MNKNTMPFILAFMGLLLIAGLFIFVGYSYYANPQSILAIGGTETTPEASFYWNNPGYNQPLIHDSGTFGTLSTEEFSYTANGINTGWFWTGQVYSSQGGCSLTTSTTPPSSVNVQLSRSGSSVCTPATATLNLGYSNTNYPAGTNAKFTNLGATCDSSYPSSGCSFNLPVPRDSRLWLALNNCPTPLGYSPSDLTLTYQIFNGTETNITISSFSHTVVRFCMSNSISVRRYDGGLASVVSPYGDVILNGGYTFPPGQTQVWQYLAPASEFPQHCPVGYSLSTTQNGDAIDAVCIPIGNPSASPTAPLNTTVSQTCTGYWNGSECFYAPQSYPSCPAGSVPNDDANQALCIAQSTFCPTGYSVLASPNGASNSTFYCGLYSTDSGNRVLTDVQTIDANVVCQTLFSTNSSWYQNGVCAVGITSVSNPTQPQPTVNPPVYVSPNPVYRASAGSSEYLLWIVGIIILAGIAYWLMTRKKRK